MSIGSPRVDHPFGTHATGRVTRKVSPAERPPVARPLSLLLTAWLTAGLALVGCGGGMVGTGTGPDEPIVREASALQQRVGVDLPAALIDPAILPSLGSRASPGSTRIEAPVSQQWRTLVRQIADVERVRLDSETFLVLVDAVLPAIRSACDETGQRACLLPEGRIEGRYTDSLVDAVETVYARAFGSVDESASGLAELRAELQSRLGTRYRLGDIELAPSDGQPFDIDLTTSLDEVLPGQRLRVRSNASGTRKELTISRATGDIVDRRYIGFSTGLPGERFTYTRDQFTGSGIADRFDVTIVADGSSERRVLVDARYRERVGAIVDDTTFRAQADNGQGFATAQEYEAVGTGIRSVNVTEESFAADGTLQGGRRCSGEPGPETCSAPADYTRYGSSGARPSDSPLSFDDDGFDSLIGMNDVIRFRVDGLPEDVVDFQVRSDDDALPLAERDLLCTGVQPAPGEARLYCTASKDRLSASVVAVVDTDSGAVSRVPFASVQPR